MNCVSPCWQGGSWILDTSGDRGVPLDWLSRSQTRVWSPRVLTTLARADAPTEAGICATAGLLPVGYATFAA